MQDLDALVLGAGTALVGKVGIDQATANANEVVVKSGTVTSVTSITNALPAGTNLVGKVGIDQTTPGTTNAVVEASATAIKTAVEALTPTATTPVIYNVTITTLDTEYSQALPANTKKFRIHLQDFATFRLAYVTGKVATPSAPYETIPANSEKYEDGLSLAALTLYFASPVSTKIAEIEVWS